mgnify:CR=1 FL=1
MMEKVENILKNGLYTIPKLLINNLRKLNITEKEAILLICLLNSEKKFNPKNTSETLGWKINEVLEEINNLSDKDMLKIEMVKVNKIHEEYLNFDTLYSKLAFASTITGSKHTKTKIH